MTKQLLPARTTLKTEARCWHQQVIARYDLPSGARAVALVDTHAVDGNINVTSRRVRRKVGGEDDALALS